MGAERRESKRKSSLTIASTVLIVVVLLVLMLFKPPFLVMTSTSETSTTKTTHVITSETKTAQSPKVHVTGMTTLLTTITGRRVEFKIKSISVIDRNFYPTLKIIFESNVYPLEFMFYRVKGGEVEWAGEAIAEEPQNVVYKRIGGYMENIIGPLKLILNVRHQGVKVYTENITIQGIKPQIKIEKIGFNVDPLSLRIGIKSLVLDIRNYGDTPLYLNYYTQRPIKVLIDERDFTSSYDPSKPRYIKVCSHESVKILLHSLYAEAMIESLAPNKTHEVKVELMGSVDKYIIPSINECVKMRIASVSIEKTRYYNVTLKVRIINNWVTKIPIGWSLRVFLNGTPITPYYDKKTIEIGENTLTISFKVWGRSASKATLTITLNGIRVTRELRFT